MIIRKDDLYWLAGFIEGEGSFSYGKKISIYGEYYNPRVTVGSTDADVMLHVATILDHGRMHTKDLPSGKTFYTVAFGGPKAIDVMRQLYPLMGNRRKQRINEILDEWEKLKETIDLDKLFVEVQE